MKYVLHNLSSVTCYFQKVLTDLMNEKSLKNDELFDQSTKKYPNMLKDILK